MTTIYYDTIAGTESNVNVHYFVLISNNKWQEGKQAGRQADKQTGNQAGRQADMQASDYNIL